MQGLPISAGLIMRQSLHLRRRHAERRRAGRPGGYPTPCFDAGNDSFFYYNTKRYKLQTPAANIHCSAYLGGRRLRCRGQNFQRGKNTDGRLFYKRKSRSQGETCLLFDRIRLNNSPTKPQNSSADGRMSGRWWERMCRCRDNRSCGTSTRRRRHA